ncbi:MAG: hypothetical protein HYW24_01325 [Candidatus Aenigmarchaeota archaeon]|nr:hypothetical protein [Candidatus Aenigmarchaeota archaeon]
MLKGQAKVDEFAWIILGAVGFVLLITLVFTSTVSRPVIEPKSLELTLAREDSHTFPITVRSEDGRKMTNVTLVAEGEIKDWLTFNKNSLDVDNSTTVKITVQVPKSAILKTYKGEIKALTQGGSSLMSLSIIVSNQTVLKLSSRPVFLGEFDIKHTQGSEILDTRENIEISKGAFSESKGTFLMSYPQGKKSITTGAYLELFVTETNKNGDLIVEFNGFELYNKRTDAGRIVIPVDKSLLNATNTINILTTGPSPFLFWSSAEYKIEKMNFVIDFVDIAERERTFELARNEADNFHHFVLQGRIVNYSTPLEEVVIKINNQIVFIDRPPLVAFNQTFDKDIQGNKLIVDRQNKISFSFEKDAFLQLKDAFIVVYFS